MEITANVDQVRLQIFRQCQNQASRQIPKPLHRRQSRKIIMSEVQTPPLALHFRPKR